MELHSPQLPQELQEEAGEWRVGEESGGGGRREEGGKKGVSDIGMV